MKLRLLLILCSLLLAFTTESVQAADLWQYGGFVDVGYLYNSNHPDTHLWRSKQTSPRTTELVPNMGLVYVRKDPAEQSRW